MEHLVNDSRTFLRLCEGKRLIIFGAGFVAGMFLRALELHGLTGRIDHFEVTSAAPGQMFRGFPVRSLPQTDASGKGPAGGPGEYDPLPGSELFCLAVHEQALSGAERALLAKGRDTVFVYPFLHELLFGHPVRRCVTLPLRTILDAQPAGEYWLAARAAGMAQEADRTGGSRSGPIDGGLLYRKALGLLSSPGTAERRLAAARRLYQNISQNGLDPAFPVHLDEDLRIIDGLHRIAAGILTGASEIRCVLYPRSPVYDELLPEEKRLQEETLAGAGFTAAEAETLKETDRKLHRLAERPERNRT